MISQNCMSQIENLQIRVSYSCFDAVLLGRFSGSSVWGSLRDAKSSALPGETPFGADSAELLARAQEILTACQDPTMPLWQILAACKCWRLFQWNRSSFHTEDKTDVSSKDIFSGDYAHWSVAYLSSMITHCISTYERDNVNWLLFCSRNSIVE